MYVSVCDAALYGGLFFFGFIPIIRNIYIRVSSFICMGAQIHCACVTLYEYPTVVTCVYRMRYGQFFVPFVVVCYIPSIRYIRIDKFEGPTKPTHNDDDFSTKKRRRNREKRTFKRIEKDEEAVERVTVTFSFHISTALCVAQEKYFL